jgi:hypothetical protein
MTYGFLAVNNSNQVLISSDTRNLHFIGKYSTPSSTIYTTNNFGGIRIYDYRVTCANTTPVTFFKNTTSGFCAVSRTRQIDPTTWSIEVIRSGTDSSYPVLYIFADPRASTAQDTHGMIVYRNDQTASFDSRLRPLTVTGSATVFHPYDPKPAASVSLSPILCSSGESTTGGYFTPTNKTINLVTGVLPSSPMYCYFSLPQAEKEKYVDTSQKICDGTRIDEWWFQGCLGIEYTRVNISNYWCFYRGGIRANASKIEAGWIPVVFGCNSTESRSDGSLFGIITDGGLFGSGGSYTNGKWPYSNQTLNTTNATTVLIADSSRYD